MRQIRKWWAGSVNAFSGHWLHSFGWRLYQDVGTTLSTNNGRAKSRPRLLPSCNNQSFHSAFVLIFSFYSYVTKIILFWEVGCRLTACWSMYGPCTSCFYIPINNKLRNRYSAVFFQKSITVHKLIFSPAKVLLFSKTWHRMSSLKLEALFLYSPTVALMTGLCLIR